jgi:hypothetical protein
MRGYIRTDGVMVATSWSDLTGGRLTTPISRTEFNDGQPFPPTVVWTHTKTDGTREDGDQSCRNWSGEYAGTSGDRGDLQNSGSGWTELETSDCQTEARLYCFQQR